MIHVTLLCHACHRPYDTIPFDGPVDDILLSVPISRLRSQALFNNWTLRCVDGSSPYHVDLCPICSEIRKRDEDRKP